MVLLFKNNNIDLYYDSRHFLYADMKGYFSVEILKNTGEIISDHLHEKKCGKLVLNFQNVKGTFIQAIPWMESDFIPKAVKAGFAKAAIITSFDPHTQLSIEKALEANDEYEAQLFEDFGSAIKWLTGQTGTDDILLHLLNGRLIIRRYGKYHFIRLDEILYFHSSDKETIVHCEAQTFVSKDSLKGFLTKLPPSFMQVHRSYIVNMDSVESVKHHDSGSYSLFLVGFPDIMIPVSKNYVSAMKERLHL